MRPSFRFAAVVFVALTGLFHQADAANPVVRFHTDLGDIDVVLLRDVAPNTVANFLGYVNRRDYDNSFIHRSEVNFVIQGGGYRQVGNDTYTVPQKPPVANEFLTSNTRGTLAMAKLSGDPNSATCQWFFNLSDTNASVLNTQNGGYTVFGRILSPSGLGTLNTIAAVPVFNFGGAFTQLPLKNYTTGGVAAANFVNLISVRELPAPAIVISRPTPTTVRLVISGVQGTAYAIQSSITLVAGSFAQFSTVTTDASGNGSYEGPAMDAKRFFRLVIP